MTAEEIYGKHWKFNYIPTTEEEQAIIAAIQEALNVNATRLAELEKENRELREDRDNVVQLLNDEIENRNKIQDTKTFNNEK
jgi:small-conductance mechanosensitive channel